MLLRSLTIWLLLAGSLFSQEIGGLSSVAVGSELRLPVKGLTAPSGTLEQLATWAGKLVVGADSPAGSTSSIDLDIGLARRQPTIYFSADSPGLYVVCLVDTSSATPTILTKRVQVGEVVPSPVNPTPPGPGPTTPDTTTPTPPAVPRKATKATYVYEKSKHQVPGAVSAALRELALGSGVFGSVVDQDVKNGEGKTPSQYERPIAMAQLKGLPCLVVEFSDGTIDAVPNVTTADDVRKAVAK
jgi:hypothetical protein